MGVALMTTLTLGLEPSLALLILVCTYVGAIYGGSRSAILLNIPGTPASAASCLDGHALARQGLAGQAMGIATSGSVLGTWIGMLFLALLTPGPGRGRRSSSAPTSSSGSPSSAWSSRAISPAATR